MNENNRQLLNAVLLPPPGGLDDFRAWRATANLDHLPNEQYSLLPFLYYRLAELQTEDLWLGLLKGIYRRAWYTNQLALKTLADLLGALNAANIPALVTGGAYLAQACYPQVALRPVQALELVIQESSALAAAAEVSRLGWQAKPAPPKNRLILPKAARKAILLFSNAAGLQLKLHQHCFKEIPHVSVDQPIWERAEAFQAGDLWAPGSARSLSPADHLLQACLSIYRNNLLAVVDAAMLMAAPAKVDWAVFKAEVEHYQLQLTVRYVIDLVRECTGAAPPAPILEALQHHSPGLAARLAHHFGLIAPARRSIFARAILKYARLAHNKAGLRNANQS